MFLTLFQFIDSFTSDIAHAECCTHFMNGNGDIIRCDEVTAYIPTPPQGFQRIFYVSISTVYFIIIFSHL